jgi:hypothetical protein
MSIIGGLDDECSTGNYNSLPPDKAAHGSYSLTINGVYSATFLLGPLQEGADNLAQLLFSLSTSIVVGNAKLCSLQSFFFPTS